MAPAVPSRVAYDRRQANSRRLTRAPRDSPVVRAPSLLLSQCSAISALRSAPCDAARRSRPPSSSLSRSASARAAPCSVCSTRRSFVLCHSRTRRASPCSGAFSVRSARARARHSRRILSGDRRLAQAQPLVQRRRRLRRDLAQPRHGQRSATRRSRDGLRELLRDPGSRRGARTDVPA